MDVTESYSLAGITIVISNSIGLLCVLLIPIDIFLTTYKNDQIDKIAEIIKLDRNYFQVLMLSKYKIIKK